MSVVNLTFQELNNKTGLEFKIPYEFDHSVSKSSTSPKLPTIIEVENEIDDEFYVIKSV